MKVNIKEKIIDIFPMILAVTIFVAIIAAIIGALGFLLFASWDNHTGQDTGYISAVDNKAFGNDKKIYLRRHPLNAQMTYGSAENDEYTYCVKGDRQDVIDAAYEAITSGKRVKVIYDERLPFALRSPWECRTAPVTKIEVVEE